jgi:hypothetical protein
MVAITRFFSRFSWDVVGFSASTICAVHCLVVPLLLMLSSFSGLEVLHNHRVETFILVFSTTIGSISIIPGWRKHHGKLLPVFIFITGIAFISFGRLPIDPLAETVFTTGGALLVAIAHWINWKLCRPFHFRSESEEI